MNKLIPLTMIFAMSACSGGHPAYANPKLYPVVLVCPDGLDHSECVPQNALDVITSIEPSELPAMCLGYAQMQLAKTALIRPGTYMKIMCEKRGS